MDCFPIDYVALGKKIRKLRKEKHLTQERMAELIGRSASFMGHIERGTRVLSLETFLNIVQVLDCSANYLLGIDRNERKQVLTAKQLLQIAADLADRK